MISPWTIYKDQKDPSLSKGQAKRGKHDSIKNGKKTHKIQQSKSLLPTQVQSPNKTHQNPPENLLNEYILQSSDQHQSQAIPSNNINIPNPQQNKLSPIINQQPNQQNQHNLSDSEQLFRGLDHPQLITDQDKSKDFLKNIVSDPSGYLDNSKLLQFCKYHQPHSDLLINEPHLPKKRKSITNLMRIEADKHLLVQEWNQLVLLKYIKSTLRVEESIEREVDNNIESVLEKLTQEFSPRISPHELLLEKLLKNEQEKMAKNKQSKSSNKDLTKKDNPTNDSNLGHASEKSPKNTKKQKQLSNSDIMQSLQQDIQKSSIIKYLNSAESPYLQGHQSGKKHEKSHHTSPKPKDSINAIQISVNNAKLAEKAIYVSKKPVSHRQSNQQSHSNQHSDPHNISGNIEKPQNNETENPQQQKNQKSSKKQQKNNIENLIKQHMALRQSKKQYKPSQKQQGVQKIQVDIRKLKGKNYIVLQNPQQAISEQSNLISPRLSKSRTINLINQYQGQKTSSSKPSPNPQSPLFPPQFHLPTLSHRTIQPQAQKKLSSSSKLLQLITNNILQQKYKSSTHNSAQDPSNSKNLIDQLFVKDKQRKKMMIRRNQSVNVKNTKDILREVNRKKLMNLDQQILELKDTERTMMMAHREKGDGQKGTGQENQAMKAGPQQIMNAMKKDFLNNGSIEDYNFMRKKPHKLTPLETQLIGLIEAGNALSHQQNTNDSVVTRQNNKYEMNISGMKFSDHQILHDMNLLSTSKPNAD